MIFILHLIAKCKKIMVYLKYDNEGKVKMVRFFLIRHGESIQNTGENVQNLPDHKVYLTQKGKEQADECGVFLEKYCKEQGITLDNATLFVSPYERTRQTASIVNSHLGIKDIKEDISLIEHQYGLFENKEHDDWGNYTEEYKYYNNYYNNNGKFYAKFPQGESPFDVALRTRQFISTLFRDIEGGKDTFFIVSHGTTIRAFLLSYFHYSPEWFSAEPNMKNCSVRLIEKIDGKNYDRDYIFGGRKER